MFSRPARSRARGGAPASPKVVCMEINGQQIMRFIGLGRRVLREIQKAQGGSGSAGDRLPGPHRSGQGKSAPRKSAPGTGAGQEYPGDYSGRLDPVYAPHPDGAADPGEVVWTWVPFEEDYSRGKDRPVLVVGRDGRWLLGLMLTSKDRNNDKGNDDRYLDIGTGPWDPQGRPSEVRVTRILRVDPERVRREGAVMDEGTFRRVVEAVR